jgi:hypothetical protein
MEGVLADEVNRLFKLLATLFNRRTSPDGLYVFLYRLEKYLDYKMDLRAFVPCASTVDIECIHQYTAAIHEFTGPLRIPIWDHDEDIYWVKTRFQPMFHHLQTHILPVMKKKDLPGMDVIEHLVILCQTFQERL